MTKTGKKSRNQQTTRPTKWCSQQALTWHCTDLAQHSTAWIQHGPSTPQQLGHIPCSMRTNLPDLLHAVQVQLVHGWDTAQVLQEGMEMEHFQLTACPLWLADEMENMSLSNVILHLGLEMSLGAQQRGSKGEHLP